MHHGVRADVFACDQVRGARGTETLAELSGSAHRVYRSPTRETSTFRPRQRTRRSNRTVD